MSRPGTEAEAKPESPPLVSVVTPVYNTRAHLAECVESVLRQTYEHWEYIVMDNCSDDGTLELAREYERRDPRIRVIAETEFLGQIENQNRAIGQMSGAAKYCKIVHADDWLFPECLERMVALAEENPTVGIVGAYRLTGDRVGLDGVPEAISVLPGRDACRAHLLAERSHRYFFGSPTSVLIRADLIRASEAFFNPDNPFQDDQEACYEVLRDNDFGFVHQVLTYTRRHDDSGFPYFVRVGAGIPDQLNLLVQYGPVYLTEAEYERRLAVVVAQYCLFLARRITSLRDPEFRAYQVRWIEKLRHSVRLGQVVRGVPRQLARMTGGRRPTG
jgi:glycosyltransferase involved in cell wall biosynthesis